MIEITAARLIGINEAFTVQLVVVGGSAALMIRIGIAVASCLMLAQTMDMMMRMKLTHRWIRRRLTKIVKINFRFVFTLVSVDIDFRVERMVGDVCALKNDFVFFKAQALVNVVE